MAAMVQGLDEAMREAIDRGDVIVREAKPSAPPRDPSNYSC